VLSEENEKVTYMTVEEATQPCFLCTHADKLAASIFVQVKERLIEE